MMTKWNDSTSAVQQASSILIVTHVNPDGDAIGSLLGLTIGLREIGKVVDAAVDGGVPDYLRYLPQQETIVSDLKQGQWDLMISVDASDEERTGESGDYGRAHSSKVVNLDHHATNTMFGNFHIVEPSAVSATEIVYDWLQTFTQSISKDVATALLTGLVTDTMGFRTSHVVPRTLEVAHALMMCGAPLVDIINRTMVSKPVSHLLLWKHVFPSVEYNDGIASAVVTMPDVQAVALDEMTDAGLVSTLVAGDEVKIAVVFKVLDEQKVELSLRAKVGYDIASVAFALGGGGHKPAAGATVNGSLAEVKARIMPMLQTVIQKGIWTSG